MGAGMDKIMPGLFVGSIRDSKDEAQVRKHGITHILSIHEDAKDGHFKDIEYLCFQASDHASQDIKKFFDQSIEFIHKARLNNGNVLVHCLAGISRSTTLVVSYVMAVTEMPWYESLNVVRAARKGANPNFGFQRQLQNFEFTTLKTTREKLFSKFGNYENLDDVSHCKTLLEAYKNQQSLILSDVNNTNNSNNSSNNNNNNNNNTNKASNYQVTFTSSAVKTYPLAFNAYGLDKDEKSSTSDTKSEKKTTIDNKALKVEDVVVNASKDENTDAEPSPPSSSSAAPTTATEVPQAEKDQIVDKIFG